MVLSGKYLWNSGIFLAKASVIINEIKKFRLDVYNSCLNALSGVKKILIF